MKKHLLWFFLIGFAVGGDLFAQSNVFIDALIAKNEATYGEAAFLALASAGLVKADGTVADAVSYIEKNNWGFAGKPDEPVALGELCYLLMRAYNLGGGLMYSLFPGPRYAAREFEYRDWVQRSPVPSRRVPGNEVLQIVGRVMADREGAK